MKKRSLTDNKNTKSKKQIPTSPIEQLIDTFSCPQEAVIDIEQFMAFLNSTPEEVPELEIVTVNNLIAPPLESSFPKILSDLDKNQKNVESTLIDGSKKLSDTFPIAKALFLLFENKGSPGKINELAEAKKIFEAVLEENNDPTNLNENIKAVAAYCLWYIHFHGLGTKQNYQIALDYILKADEKNFFLTKSVLGIFYTYGFGVEKNTIKAIDYYQQAIRQNDTIFGFYFMGACYLNGLGVEKNIEQAITLMSKAACQNNMKAINSLAKIFYEKENFRIAGHLYHLAAENKIVEAECMMGKLLYDGIGVIQNIPSALIYLSRASEQHSAEASYFLAQLYDWGTDEILEDINLAIVYYMRAAKKNHPLALFALACLHTENGNHEEAMKLYQKAAEHGCIRAKNHLASLEKSLVIRDQVFKIQFHYKDTYDEGNLIIDIFQDQEPSEAEWKAIIDFISKEKIAGISMMNAQLRKIPRLNWDSTHLKCIEFPVDENYEDENYENKNAQSLYIHPSISKLTTLKSLFLPNRQLDKSSIHSILILMANSLELHIKALEIPEKEYIILRQIMSISTSSNKVKAIANILVKYDYDAQALLESEFSDVINTCLPQPIAEEVLEYFCPSSTRPSK